MRRMRRLQLIIKWINPVVETLKTKKQKHMDPRTLPAVMGIMRILSATFGCAGKILLAVQEREEVGFLRDIDLQMQT